ncbi:RagB/SusD family nutrient uptake outer membrane protein [Chitinophaga oryzae]|uniref:RagB/SusD family nutrient uptake outer membrane protein n=1 Tax=Chitinophaga oryzae TaxID=2725414 RepID=A0AAE6ZJ59_9BACT|nr:RagB/SusD family nutrient uptake outer membrane protein [Chitinophaga oryzae]QJB33689.1 RagB/SusD family nutrient uptake outer membrane protein [Chitinophaga oryzae]QJB40214.1 RagB/SusD family nutrient uptake outer membrane protein [Chitinophaga oryzae]
MKRIYRRIGTALFAALFFTACQKDVLDKVPLDSFSDESVWKDLRLARAFAEFQYNILPGAGHYWNTLSNRSWALSSACDEAFNRFDDYNAVVMNSGSLTPDNLSNFDIWEETYKRIQDCNLFLSRIDGVPGDDAVRGRLKAEVTYLRAYAYFKLISDYGGVPLVTKPFDLNSNFVMSRSTFDECVSFIVKECDAAAAVLPGSYGNNAAELGRATKGAALALKSRVLLYAASPQWNTGNDNARWQKASDAAKAVIDMPNYQLFTGAYPILFTTYNTELIMTRGTNKQYQWSSFQGVEMFLAPNGFRGWTSFAPSQGLVDAFGMANGKDISDPASGYDPQHPYANRDPRFYQDILCDGLPYGRPEYFKDRYDAGHSNEVETYEGGLDTETGWDTWNSSYTRYSFRKYQDTTYNYRVETQTNKFWVIARLSEIYLNYAEAEFHLGHEDVARQYLDLLRHRAGITTDLPGTLAGAALLKKIQNERQVELCLEGHRYYDVRRWKIAGETENKPLNGMKIVKNADGTKTYTVIKVQDRVFKPEHYLLPIPRDEIRRTNLPQNPGYK